MIAPLGKTVLLKIVSSRARLKGTAYIKDAHLNFAPVNFAPVKLALYMIFDGQILRFPNLEIILIRYSALYSLLFWTTSTSGTKDLSIFPVAFNTGQ